MLSNSLAALRCLQTHSNQSNQCSRQWLVLNSCRLCCHPAWDSRQPTAAAAAAAAVSWAGECPKHTC